MHKGSGRLHVRQKLEKIMNHMVIVKVCCGPDGEEVMHEEHVEGGFKGKTIEKHSEMKK